MAKDSLIVGFTGTRGLTQEQEFGVERVLHSIEATEIVTGACIGVDTFVSVWFFTNRPEVKQTIYVPANRSRVSSSFVQYVIRMTNAEVFFMAEGSAYRDRNACIVDTCDRLVGFMAYPERHEKSIRSGSWQTARMARRGGKRVTAYVLNP